MCEHLLRSESAVNLYNRSVLYNKSIDTYDEGVYRIESHDTSQ